MITNEQILAVMSQTFGVVCDEQTSQMNCPEWDSVKHLDLAVNLEMEFDLDLEPEEIGQMKDFAAIKRILANRA